MKCALPGRYGKKVSIESSAMADSYNQKDEEYIKNIHTLFEKAVDEYNKTIDEIIEDYYSYENEEERSIKVINDFEKLKQELLQKDKEEHEK